MTEIALPEALGLALLAIKQEPWIPWTTFSEHLSSNEGEKIQGSFRILDKPGKVTSAKSQEFMSLSFGQVAATRQTFDDVHCEFV